MDNTCNFSRSIRLSFYLGSVFGSSKIYEMAGQNLFVLPKSSKLSGSEFFLFVPYPMIVIQNLVIAS